MAPLALWRTEVTHQSRVAQYHALQNDPPFQPARRNTGSRHWEHGGARWSTAPHPHSGTQCSTSQAPLPWVACQDHYEALGTAVLERRGDQAPPLHAVRVACGFGCIALLRCLVHVPLTLQDMLLGARYGHAAVVRLAVAQHARGKQMDADRLLEIAREDAEVDQRRLRLAVDVYHQLWAARIDSLERSVAKRAAAAADANAAAGLSGSEPRISCVRLCSQWGDSTRQRRSAVMGLLAAAVRRDVDVWRATQQTVRKGIQNCRDLYCLSIMTALAAPDACVWDTLVASSTVTPTFPQWPLCWPILATVDFAARRSHDFYAVLTVAAMNAILVTRSLKPWERLLAAFPGTTADALRARLGAPHDHLLYLARNLIPEVTAVALQEVRLGAPTVEGFSRLKEAGLLAPHFTACISSLFTSHWGAGQALRLQLYDAAHWLVREGCCTLQDLLGMLNGTEVGLACLSLHAEALDALLEHSNCEVDVTHSQLPTS
jgi:hypothetical protein